MILDPRANSEGDLPTNSTVAEPVEVVRLSYSTPTLADFGSFTEVTKGFAGIGADAGIYS